LDLEAPSSISHEAAPFLDLFMEIRNQLREAKQFALADQIRERLEALGVVLEDTVDRTTWRWR
jgi:cysteinyl-tRNA synthetase